MSSRRVSVSLGVFSALLIDWAGTAAAQTVLVGTGDPTLDIPAVQTAVDGGGEVILLGHFSFDAAPTIAPDLPGFPMATVRVSTGVNITGVEGEDDEMTTIEGGQVPFQVEAHGSSVTIQRLRFVHPTAAAIDVTAVSGLVIASCKIEGVQPLNNLGMPISISTTFNLPNPNQPGQPERISGTVRIVGNDIDAVGATALDATLGITFFSVGVPGAEVDAYVSGNRVRNTTEPAINVRRLVGRAFIERNELTTADFAAPPPRPEVIRVVNTGSFVIARNSIDCRWPQAFGIGVFSQFAAWPMVHAIVAGNDVRMSPPNGTIFGPNSAAISVRGFANGNLVFGNTLRGSAGNAISVTPFPPPPAATGVPSGNTLLLNRLDDFVASGADIFIGAGVQDTLVIGEGSIEDHGVGTVVVPLR